MSVTQIFLNPIIWGEELLISVFIGSADTADAFPARYPAMQSISRYTLKTITVFGHTI